MKRVSALILFLIAPLAARGSPGLEPELSASFNRPSLAIGERVELTVVLEGEGVSQGASFNLPEIPSELRLVRSGAPSHQFNTRILNGRVSRWGRVSRTYVFEARKVGIAGLSPITCRVGDKLLKTKPIAVRVSEAEEPAPIQEGDTVWQPPSDPYLHVTVSRSEVYVGQQVKATWRLYFREPMSEVGIARVPDAGDFMSIDLGTASSLNPVTNIFGRARWNAAYIKSVALFPVKAGAAVIDPLVMNVEKGGMSFFGGGFPERKRVSSPSIKINVKPLPEQGRPGDFSGAVGRFKIRVDKTSATLETDRQFKFILAVEGSSHPDFIPKPEIDLPEGFELYTEAVEKDTRVKEGDAFGMRVFKMILVPHKAGDFTLPPFYFHYFDPEEGAYREARSERMRLRVEKGAGISISEQGPSASVVSAKGEDLRYIKPDRQELSGRGGWVLASAPAVALQALPLAAYAAALGIRRRRERLAKDLRYARRLRAGKRSKKLLKEAKKHADAGETADAYASAYRCVTAFIGDRLDLSCEGMSTADAVSALGAAGASAEAKEGVRALLEECDRARFASGSASTERAGELVAETARLLRHLDKETAK